MAWPKLCKEKKVEPDWTSVKMYRSHTRTDSSRTYEMMLMYTTKNDNGKEPVKIPEAWRILLGKHHKSEGRDQDKAQGSNYQTNSETLNQLHTKQMASKSTTRNRTAQYDTLLCQKIKMSLRKISV